ncbi:hypothetical protein VTI28DRAFT_7020 [Corynascus sepedonium]
MNGQTRFDVVSRREGKAIVCWAKARGTMRGAWEVEKTGELGVSVVFWKPLKLLLKASKDGDHETHGNTEEFQSFFTRRQDTLHAHGQKFLEGTLPVGLQPGWAAVVPHFLLVIPAPRHGHGSKSFRQGRKEPGPGRGLTRMHGYGTPPPPLRPAARNVDMPFAFFGGILIQDSNFDVIGDILSPCLLWSAWSCR